MLHQTLPTFLSLQSFSCNHPSSSPPSCLFSSQEMEGVVTKALKKSFWQEMKEKTSHEHVCEDAWVENVIPSDDFFVDDLLDFSKDEVFKVEEEEEKDFVSVSSHEEEPHSGNFNGVSVKDDFNSLSVPADDLELEQLEWLSRFVEESFSLPYSEENPLCKIEISQRSGEETGVKRMEVLDVSATPFPAKARSKRSKTGGRVWSMGSSGDTTECSSYSSGSTSSGSSASTSCLIFTNPTPNPEYFYHFGKPPEKRLKKKTVRMIEATSSGSVGIGGGGGGGSGQSQRRCSHCGVQKTPQWRTGPHGAKTLCNACGVRFKSGRLLPEYRPACSPTFSSEVHSNNHRKVLEMRRKKEVGPPVRSF